MGASPESEFHVQPLDQVAPPAALNDSAEDAMARALKDRPDLLAQAARIRAAHSAVEETKSSFLPTLSFNGNIGYARAYGEQLPLPGVYASGELWTAQLNLQWDLFEAGRRRSELARAEARQKQAQAELDSIRDDAEDQVWMAYTNVKTAYAQQQAAATLLSASQTSWEAATEAYKDGVRTLIDVVSAQRALARARSEDITARTGLLRETATLAFRTGDLLQAARHP
jgi:outer membrane protein